MTGADGAIEHLRTRERAERATAKRAQSVHARWVHQELAQLYALRARAASPGQPDR